MQYQTKSIISAVEHIVLPNHKPCSVLTFQTGFVLAVSHNTLALYKSIAAISDPLGNGLLVSLDIPKSHTLAVDDQTGNFVMHFDAGFVALSEGKALLIKPHCVEYYATPMEGLKGENMICQLLFPSEQLFS